ncbi:MAG TPA: hypothetical protein VG013_36105, partial [Gemmataceae bacterium]|nr:hypothetical protein [Gemmataceae bacterium]
MLQTLLDLCLALSGKNVKRPALRRRPAFRRPSCRPRLEALEDRCLLSAGALDPTFGNGAGYVTTSLTNSDDTAYSVLIQPDGKILATGDARATSGKHNVTVTHNAGLVRYNADGSLDTSFGSGGEALGPPSTSLGYEIGALYPITGSANDGKILVGGLAGGFSIARFNANGTLDPSFGSNGVATANFGATPGTIGAFYTVIQSDGKIVALGEAADTNGGTGVSELARFNSDGSLDASFGQGGLV